MIKRDNFDKSIILLIPGEIIRERVFRKHARFLPKATELPFCPLDKLKRSYNQSLFTNFKYEFPKSRT